MSDEVKNKYHFEKIFELSKTKVKEELPNEWLFLCKEDKKTKERMCICQRKIHHVFIFINKITGALITVGSSCKKKLQLNYPKIDKYLHEFLNNDPGEYGAIENALEFSEELRDEVLYYFEKSLSENDNVKILESISNKLIEVISIYIKKNINAEILITLLNRYKNKIKRVKEYNEEQADRIEKIRKEREEKERLEVEKKERELQQQVRYEEERRIAKERRIKEEEIIKYLEAEKLEKERINEERIRRIERDIYLQEQIKIKAKEQEKRQKILSEWPEYFTN
jgi:hypothetical protein